MCKTSVIIKFTKMKIPDLRIKHLYLVVYAGLLVTLVTAAPKVENELTSEDYEQNVEETEQEALGDDKSDARGSRFIALVEVPPTPCTTTDGTNTQGTCLPSSECTSKGGTESGTCYNGFGVCCLFVKTCNAVVGLNNTYFVNPDTNTNVGGACTVTLNRVSANICQFRLDFQTLTLSQPDLDGLCKTDFLTVAVGTTAFPMICGENSGSHMYINVDPNGGAVKLTVDRFAVSTAVRTWNIRVTQISCDSRFRAPDGCLQYYTETSGIIRSFNFNEVPPATFPNDGTRQIANHNYGICIQKASGYCGIIWERDTTLQYSFTVSGSVSATLPGLIGDPASSSTGSACTTDYVIIPEGVDNLGVPNDRFCGVGFPLTVTSSAVPFVLYVRNNADELTDEGNYGFQLSYRQTTIC